MLICHIRLEIRVERRQESKAKTKRTLNLKESCPERQHPKPNDDQASDLEHKVCEYSTGLSYSYTSVQREYGFYIIALMEPFLNCRHIQKYKRRLGMEAVMSNVNGKIWLFFVSIIKWEVMMDTEQQVTFRVYHQDISKHIIMTFVYAKCSSLERLELWDYLYCLASDMELPWLVRGDFNVIFQEEEKIEGLPVYPSEYEAFAFYVEHLVRTGSDHAPLLMSCGKEAMNFVKPFKFLNFWINHETFKDVVRQNWVANFISDPFWMFKQKLKRVKIALSHWSKLTYGNIFKQLAIREDIVRAQAELKKYLSIEKQYWKQKAGMNWFAEGDRNTRFFPNHFSGKRQKLQLKRIQNSEDDWI
ncbi:uncharacterized protein LOC142163474 [Nicotiana tabacum]|uniref:Uncharacterized protein LOC142163474 n=1 Tax=Nicotiana tabacum TaxID=4097 RepID=A0AC58RVV0_TOBAC